MINKNQLIQAISSRKLISFTYENHPVHRAAPHAIYLSSANNECLDAYQYDGYSKSGNLPDWRNFELEKIRGLEILGETFDIVEGYKSHSPKYRNFIHKI